MIRYSLLYASVALSLCSILTAPAYASLGDNITRSPASTRVSKHNTTPLPGAVLMTTAAFSRSETLLDSGGKITEFSDSSGTIFAVAWDAPTMPDLSALLGSYKTSWLESQRAENNKLGPTLSSRHFSANAGDWSIVSTGRLRAYRGYSWLRSAIPPGFDLTELAK